MKHPIFGIQNLSKSYGTKDLFKDLSFTILEGAKVGLIGRNGSGKSTLLKILAKLETEDSGILTPVTGLKIGYLAQSADVPDISPLDFLILSLKESQISDYEKEELARKWLQLFNISEEIPSAQHLSGGWRKRLLLAREMLHYPDLLLLDEPTNHLDLEGVLWLEEFLLKEAPSFIVVSHDRFFLEKVVNEIVEIDASFPKGLFSAKGSYLSYLEKKENFLTAQLEQERSLRTKARQEKAWLSVQAKARTTKSKSRIDDAEELFSELKEVKQRNTIKTTAIDFQGSERETRKLVVAKNLKKEMGEKTLFSQLDFILSPGSRLGLIGANGSGKTTLLKMIAGEETITQGTIKKADFLKIVYFDQYRNQLPTNLTLKEALCTNGEYVEFRGRQIHIHGWCKRFLFSQELLNIPISKLSGGERARIAIAHLMLKPADLLLLDEPTNDLDIPTLEALEASLLDFPGAVVLITHDRAMMSRICNQVLAIDGGNTEFFADYFQWEKTKKKEIPQEISQIASEKAPSKGLSYQEKKEYEQVTRKIEKLEENLKEITSLLDEGKNIEENCKKMEIVQIELEKLYLRWEELEIKQ